MKRNIEIRYVYVKRFDWENPMLAQEFAGHPKPGMVYRSGYDVDTKTYFLYVDMPSLIMVPETEFNVEGKSLFHLTKSNLLSITPKEEFLDTMIKWFGLEDKSEAQRVHAETVDANKTEIKQGLSQSLMLHEPTEEQMITEVSKLIGNVFMTNKDLFEVITKVIKYSHEYDLNQSPIQESVVYGPEGKGANILSCHETLEDYMSHIRRGGDNPEDLYRAIWCLIREAVRRNIQGIDDETHRD